MPAAERPNVAVAFSFFGPTASDPSTDDARILLRNQSSEVVQKILSLLPSFTELGFLAFINCESADFSDVDICGLPNLAFINLNGTENNFEEQDYECANTEDSPFYFLE